MKYLLCLIVTMLAPVARADKLADRVERAEQKYQKVAALAEDQFLEEIELQTKKALSAGDKKRVDALKSDFAAFKKEKRLPTSISISKYRKTIVPAALKLAKEYGRAITQYTRQQELGASALIETKLMDLNREHFRIWRYKNGWFIRTGPDAWEEVSGPNKRFEFKEVGRTPEYVDIEKGGRVRVRIFADHCEISTKPYHNHRMLYKGQYTIE